MQNNWLPNFASNKTCILYLNKIHRVFSVQQMLLLVNMMIWWLLLLPWVTRLQVDHHHRLLMQVSDKTFIVSANTNEDIHNKIIRWRSQPFHVSRPIRRQQVWRLQQRLSCHHLSSPIMVRLLAMTHNTSQHQPQQQHQQLPCCFLLQLPCRITIIVRRVMTFLLLNFPSDYLFDWCILSQHSKTFPCFNIQGWFSFSNTPTCIFFSHVICLRYTIKQ